MKTTIKSLGQVLLISFSAAVLSACQTDDAANLPSSSGSLTVIEPGTPGGVSTQVKKITALVSAIDYQKRTVTLQDDKGKTHTMEVGPEATNFEQIKVGDHVIVEAAEEMAVYMREKNAPNTDGAASIVAKAAPGEKPGVLFAETAEMTATVTAVDLNKHTATLKFADGSSKTVAVRPDVTLNKNQIGRQVVFRLTSAMAITVEAM